jgi:hypothetical protein
MEDQSGQTAMAPKPKQLNTAKALGAGDTPAIELLRSRDQEDRSSKPAQANSSQDPILKKTFTKIGLVEWFKVKPRVQALVPQKKKKKKKGICASHSWKSAKDWKEGSAHMARWGTQSLGQPHLKYFWRPCQR